MKKKEKPCAFPWNGITKLLRIMRLTFLIILIGLMKVSAVSYSQQSKLTMNVHNLALKDALGLIEDQSNYVFFYNADQIELDDKVNLSFVDKSVSEILDELLNGKEITYKVTDRRIVLYPKEIKSNSVQQKNVTGNVSDSSGQPLPGVSIIIKGTTIGTVTDFDGNFSLTNVPEGATLIFSFVGMKTQEVEAAAQSVFNVVMEEDAIGIEEVVAVGYGVQKKATLTGAVGNVKSEEMILRPAANTTELLQGQVAGLYTIQSSGLPGSDATKLNIRGYGNNPLVLIDGIEGSLGQIDPNDIESVSVLKDAAASIYGARAGNGVILVTTKRGENKPAEISYHGSVSFSSPTRLPDLVGAREWAELVHEIGQNPDDFSPDHIHYDPDSKRLINTLDNSDFLGYDWADKLYKDWTPQHQHNISATGGTEKIRYFLSAGYVDQASNFNSGDYDFNRYNIRSNIDAQVAENLSVAVDFAYYKTKIDKANFGLNDMYNSLSTAKPVYPYIHEADPTRAASSGFLQRSPYFQTFKEYSGFVDDRDQVLQGALELKYNIPFVEGLVAKARINYEETNKWLKSVSRPFDVWEYDPIAAGNNEDPWIKWGIQNSNNMKVFSSRTTETLPQLSLQYDKVIGDHSIKAVAIGETWTYKWTSLQGTRKDILSFEAPYLIYASEEGKDNAENLEPDGDLGVTERARVSLIGRVNYDYKGKYMLEVAMRADASGEYPKNSRWGYFPSVSAGWRISEESFLKDNFEALNNLKIRASYGVLGNDAVSSFDYLTGYTISQDFYIFGSTPAPVISSAGLANPDITWETMKMSNVGIDATFWDGLFGFTIDGFYRLREDILAQPQEQIPSTFGASLPKTNLNKRDNRGIEISITHANRIGDFSYEISPMFSWARGKYVELDEEVLPTSGDLNQETLEFNRLWNERYTKEGKWDDRYWGFVTDGFFMDQEQIDNHTIDQDQAGNQTIKVGDLIYKDLNGDDVIDWRDQAIIATGSTNTNDAASLPNKMYSLDINLQWKRFSLNMLWQGASDYLVNITSSLAAPWNEAIPLEEHYKYRAIVGQDGNGMDYITNPDNFKLPPLKQDGRTANNSKSSDFWIQDAAYLRLKNINLSYSIPHSLLQKVGFDKCIVYFSGTNLITFSNLDIWKDATDPEVINADNRRYPPVKKATFGLRITL